jgi:hypothetical protein
VSLSRPLIGSSRSSLNAFVTPGYASCSSKGRHHRVVINGDEQQDTESGGEDRDRRWRRLAKTPLTSADVFLGRHRVRTASQARCCRTIR